MNRNGPFIYFYILIEMAKICDENVDDCLTFLRRHSLSKKTFLEKSSRRPVYDFGNDDTIGFY